MNKIRTIIEERKDTKWWDESEEKVIGKYGRIFSSSNIDKLSKEDFKSFLLIKNNYHWEGIHRQNNLITSDMSALKNALKILLDEDNPIENRLYKLFPRKGSGLIKGLGRAIVTPILLVAYPDKYGVWNNKSEEGLREMSLFPEFKRGTSFVEKYLEFNEVLLNLSKEYGVSLWQLDGILGMLGGRDPSDVSIFDEDSIVDDIEKEGREHGIENVYNFAMEKHLEDFLISNWEGLPIGQEYDLIYEDGELISQQYRTGVGPIDILVQNKKTGEYLVIELKKGRSSDKIVGQILRYMGWIKKHSPGDSKVKGLIIVPEIEDKVEYALELTTNIEIMEYKVNFTLE